MKDDFECQSWQRLMEDERVQFLSWNNLDELRIEDIVEGKSSKEISDFVFSEAPRAYTNLDQGFEYIKIAE